MSRFHTVYDCSTGTSTQVPFTPAEEAAADALAAAGATILSTRATADSNGSTLRTKAQAALTANDTFLATVATRRTNIATGKTTATSLSTATVTTVAQAQTAIRQIGSMLVQVATALDDLNNQSETVTKENNAVIRLLLGQLDSTANT